MSDPSLKPTGSSDLSVLSLYLAQMPAEWNAQLYQAAIKGFDYAVIQLTEQIPDVYAPLAHQLKAWALDFQFDSIMALIQEIPE